MSPLSKPHYQLSSDVLFPRVLLNQDESQLKFISHASIPIQKTSGNIISHIACVISFPVVVAYASHNTLDSGFGVSLQNLIIEILIPTLHVMQLRDVTSLRDVTNKKTKAGNLMFIGVIFVASTMW